MQKSTPKNSLAAVMSFNVGTSSDPHDFCTTSYLAEYSVDIVEVWLPRVGDEELAFVRVRPLACHRYLHVSSQHGSGQHQHEQATQDSMYWVRRFRRHDTNRRETTEQSFGPRELDRYKTQNGTIVRQSTVGAFEATTAAVAG